jgi:PTH1 family peptidyl-tRNA hydrolase
MTFTVAAVDDSRRSGHLAYGRHRPAATVKTMWLIVGLGNPGEEYAQTYHNVGFRVVQRIAAQHNVPIKERCGPALTSGKVVLAGEPAVLVLPRTFMNNSGSALPPVLERFEASAGDIIVVYDDLALPLGKLRVRQKGSAGGHNGIKSTISILGSDEFLRVRVGIRPDREVGEVRDFVLSRVAKGDRELLVQTEELAVKAVETLIAAGLEQAMAEYNGIDLREELKDN